MTDPARSVMRAAVVHTTGGAHVLRIEDALRPTVGEYPPEQPPEAPGVKAGSIRVEPLVMQPNGEQLADIGELIASGALQVGIARTLPLSLVRDAHELSESGHTRGKIVLTVDSPSSA